VIGCIGAAAAAIAGMWAMEWLRKKSKELK
jgi:hypothetical protein